MTGVRPWPPAIVAAATDPKTKLRHLGGRVKALRRIAKSRLFDQQVRKGNRPAS
jgi:hypothetical protein